VPQHPLLQLVAVWEVVAAPQLLPLLLSHSLADLAVVILVDLAVVILVDLAVLEVATLVVMAVSATAEDGVKNSTRPSLFPLHLMPEIIILPFEINKKINNI